MSTQVLSTRDRAGQCPMQAYRNKWTRRTAPAPITKRRTSWLGIKARKYGIECAECTSFGRVQPLQSGNLARVANLEEGLL